MDIHHFGFLSQCDLQETLKTFFLSSRLWYILSHFAYMGVKWKYITAALPVVNDILPVFNSSVKVFVTVSGYDVLLYGRVAKKILNKCAAKFCAWVLKMWRRSRYFSTVCYFVPVVESIYCQGDFWGFIYTIQCDFTAVHWSSNWLNWTLWESSV